MVIEKLRKLLPDHELSEIGGLPLITGDQDSMIPLLIHLKKKAKINLLMDFTCIHYPGRVKCFCLVYNLLSLVDNLRVIVHSHLGVEESAISICEQFPGSVWYEREIYDMYGVKFKDCPDHRRILMDEDFEGHPLAKHFPLTGFVEPRYNVNEQAIVNEKVDLAQDYRYFDNISPWLGTKYKEE